MMSEEQFTLSQNECASMLGMTLSEYQKYCKDLKVPKYDDNLLEQEEGNTKDILEFLGIDESKLKKIQH